MIYYTIHDIINRITWYNINKKLHYIKFLLNNKDFLYFFDKLNKNIFSEKFDIRIKNIITNPIEMFKYLRKENDFIKWVFFLENLCNSLYINPILFYENDYRILGKIIFNLTNIKNQELTDKFYKKIINYGNKYPKFILENNRINLKIKDFFENTKCNINLGILAKHLLQNKDNIISLEDDVEINKIILLQNKLDLFKNKYVKYKNKYNKIKNK